MRLAIQILKLKDIQHYFTFCYIIFTIFIISIESFPQSNSYSNVSLAGFRASRINSSYPDNIFPDENYWVYVGNGMSHKFTKSSPSSIWLVSIYEGNGDTRIGFPYASKNILASDYDQNEEYFNRFDNEGIKIFLQVEPGSASVDTLINVILTRYANHPSVVGFGIDVEWLEADYYSEGKPVTNAEAQRWENLVKSFNPDYQLFLKHYRPEWMPPTYRGDIIFIDDGQQFSSIEQMKYYFKVWSDNFTNNKVSYQIGYPSDEIWWKEFKDPVKDIGNALIDAIPNLYGLYWVDFSITKIFPMNVTGINNLNTPVKDYKLMQNYPNPFNPATTIRYSVPQNSFVKIILYDILGKAVKTLVNEEKTAGNYSVTFDAKNLPGGRQELSSGIYFYRLQSGKFVDTKKMILLR